MPFTVQRRRLAVLVGAALCAAPAFAQQTEQQLPEVRARGARVEPGSRNDVSSTATKTDTPLRDVPASVVIVPKETLREQGVTDMNRALYNVSSAQPQMGGGYGFADNYTIRGQSILFLRDGYPDGTAQNGYRRTMADVERIEVVKGPGSALYGSGGAGGTVNVITKAPSARALAEVSASAGSFGTRGITIDAGGSLGQFPTRVIANAEHSDGFRGLSRDIREFLPSAAWSIGSDKLLTIDFDHRSIETTPDNYGIVFDFNRNIAAAPREARYYSPMNRAEQTVNRLTLAHEWQLSAGTVMRSALITDGRDIDMLRNAGGNGGNSSGAMTGRTLREQHDRARYTTLQNEWVFKPGTAHVVLAGIQYSDSAVDTRRIGYNLPNITDVNNPVVPETTSAGLAPVAAQGFDRRIEGRTLAAYAQDQMTLSEQWKVRAGLRYDRTHFRDAGVQGTAFRDIDETKGMVGGSLGAVWQPSRSWSLFAGAARGGFVNLSTEPTAVSREPEKNKQYEAGVKSTLLNGALDGQLALFQVERENHLITLPGAASATPEGHDRTRGIEFDALARPAARWKVVANAYIQDAEVLSNTIASNAILGVTENISGKQPTGVARAGGRLWTSYQFYGSEANGAGAGVGFTRKGESYADSLNRYRVPAYTVFDASVYYRQRSWDVGVGIYNLTDREYYTNPTFAGALPGEPRSLYLTFRWRPV